MGLRNPAPSLHPLALFSFNLLRMRSLIAVVIAAAVATGSIFLPWSDTLRGLSLDSLVWQRQLAFGPQFDSASSPTVVVAIDEETYRREPFRSTPKVMWTNELATVIDALIDGGAAVVGVDVILPTSVAPRLRDFDRPFLQTLRKHSRDGRLVLTKVQHSLDPILPAPGQRFAVDHNRNIRGTNLYTDDRGIVRGVPVSFELSAGQNTLQNELSFSTELAKRALGKRLEIESDGRASRDGRPVPIVGENNLLVNFDDNQRGIPTYSLSDLHACAAADEHTFFRQHFDGKVVLLGAVLDVEDRKLTSLRYATAPDNAAFISRCRNQPLPGLLSGRIIRDTVPGVYVHAFAVNNFIRGNFLSQTRTEYAALMIYAVAFAVALTSLMLSATLAGALVVGGTFAWAGLATFAFEKGIAIPLLEPPIAAAIAFLLMTAYRFTVTDRDKRMLRQMFGLFLAPSVIEQMLNRGQMPELGGETRELTVYFADIANFATLSENMTPDALVKFLNDYFSAMTDVVEERGGFVDKYVGDAIVAVFGAPHEEPDHARNAVVTALSCQERLQALNAKRGLTNDEEIRHRIGINTGPMLVGNIGSRRRFNYTVVGDAVNLASRLENANKEYGTTILVSEETMQRCGDAVTFREIDRVKVKGRETPVTIYEPLGAPSHSVRDDGDSVYASALAAYRAGDFETAISIWQQLEETDRVAVTMSTRSRKLLKQQPVAWDGVYNLDDE